MSIRILRTMKPKKDNNELGLEVTYKSPFFKKKDIARFLELLPVLLVGNDLDDLFFRDEVESLIKLKKEFEKPDFSVVVIQDFLSVKERILKRLRNLNKLDSDEKIMLLIYMVSSFETMVNYHLHDELKVKKLSESEIGYALRLPVEGKLGWLLKLLYEKGYTENENWPIIKRFIEARNFFVHYKTSTIDTYNLQLNLLTKDSFMDFLEAACNCNSYLIEINSEACKKHFLREERIEAITKALTNLPSRPENDRLNRALLDVILTIQKQR